MKFINKYLVMTIASTLALTACGGDSDSSGNEKKPYNNTPAKPTSTKHVNMGISKTAQAWLDAHNVYRNKHKVANLKWSAKIANSAQKYANTCPKRHSNAGYGENMAFASYKQTAKKVLGRWYKEESNHDYRKDYQGNSGHFTQIVWKNTTEVGCAQASNCGGKWSDVVICQYNPAGNYVGQFGENVLQPK